MKPYKKLNLEPIEGTKYHFFYKLSQGLRAFVDFVGRLGSWAVLPLILFTCADAFLRKLGPAQIDLAEWASAFGMGWFFQSTLMQELEWHFHTILFALVLGFGYIHNTHVRVDVVRETLHFRKKAWLEFIGCTIFMIPFTVILGWFAVEYAYKSYEVNEVSASLVGLGHRWVIKSVLVVGMLMAFLAGVAVWLQTVIILFAPQGDQARFPLMTLDWPEEEGDKIEGKERIKLEDFPDDDVRGIATAENPKGGS